MPEQRKVKNIGSAERWKRLTFGLVMLLIAGIATFLMVMGDFHRLWRLLIAVPLYFGGQGIFQASDGT